MEKLQKIMRAIKGVSIARFSDTLFCEPQLYKEVSSKDCDLDKIKSLIESGVDLNECSSNGNTPLHKAIILENIPIVRLLLTNCAKLFIKNKKDETAYDISQNKPLVRIYLQAIKKLGDRLGYRN
ncbi:ankyrin repeat domain-containing protein [Wolbachia endosymbiont of Drosophila pseudotakahashii]|uniref:ankyrin repeat domain-containing protein n=1 Tax=Wolbachia endosymbiont of Drosophila pseudotakahashii TaxID=375919 RepID=UPI0022310812|nr:ankyrin repeat domain-containing protein [Wolbachia endosymbiont of Drosophila pseudotakahashii]MCX3064509.1 ankyrin repeat domain-containing protein [Wolbachia endosymbiont of Drosophila pseudotakahashii]UZE37991.1 ankyrin repeat domain-containing protein [Wolbachia endosymbiont of Drosophila pseudotakahashii]